jgi:hypothetical protein
MILKIDDGKHFRYACHVCSLTSLKRWCLAVRQFVLLQSDLCPCVTCSDLPQQLRMRAVQQSALMDDVHYIGASNMLSHRLHDVQRACTMQCQDM